MHVHVPSNGDTCTCILQNSIKISYTCTCMSSQSLQLGYYKFKQTKSTMLESFFKIVHRKNKY